MTVDVVTFPPPTDVDPAALCAAMVRAAGPRELGDIHHPAATLYGEVATHAVIYRVLLDYAIAAAPQLGVDLEACNFQYAKLLEYQGPEDGMEWHTDVGVEREEFYTALGLMEQWQADEMNGRRLSISVQMSDPADYVGGDLELQTADGTVVAPREQGTAIVFRPDTPHRVTPLESGERLSLISFFGYSPRGPAL